MAVMTFIMEDTRVLLSNVSVYLCIYSLIYIIPDGGLVEAETWWR
jgi:hypothetical protein